MKLIFCPQCEDIVKLRFSWTYCECKDSYGMYQNDGINAIIGGRAISLGIANSSLVKSLRKYNDWKDEMGIPLEAFIIPKNCKTIKNDRELK